MQQDEQISQLQPLAWARTDSGRVFWPQAQETRARQRLIPAPGHIALLVGARGSRWLPRTVAN